MNISLVEAVAFYVAGTVFGLYIARQMAFEATERTIDYLIEMKMIKWRKLDDGEIELLPLNDK